MRTLLLLLTAAMLAAPQFSIADPTGTLEQIKQTGKVRALGISTHSERTMLNALQQLEGLDYIMFPYNFIHARADYSEFLPKAIKQWWRRDS